MHEDPLALDLLVCLIGKSVLSEHGHTRYPVKGDKMITAPGAAPIMRPIVAEDAPLSRAYITINHASIKIINNKFAHCSITCQDLHVINVLGRGGGRTSYTVHKVCGYGLARSSWTVYMGFKQ